MAEDPADNAAPASIWAYVCDAVAWLIPLSIPASIALGALSLLTGWLGFEWLQLVAAQVAQWLCGIVMVGIGLMLLGAAWHASRNRDTRWRGRVIEAVLYAAVAFAVLRIAAGLVLSPTLLRSIFAE